MPVVINVSDRPFEKWSIEQRDAAREIGDVIDLGFPEIDWQASSDDVWSMARKYLDKIRQLAPQGNYVYVVGEPTFVYALVTLLVANGYIPFAGTTRRTIKKNADGTETVVQAFGKFRLYE